MKSKNKISNSSAGFTLIEVLIATAMLSIIIAAVYGSIFPVINGRKEIEVVLERSDVARSFLDVFSIEAQSAFFKSSNPYTRFSGERKWAGGRAFSEIAFTTFSFPMHGEASPKGDLSGIRYFLEEDGEGRTSLYKEVWNPYVDEKGFKIEIMPQVEGFEVKYLNGRGWVPVWDGILEKRVPDAVKASIFIKEEGGIKEYSVISRTMIKG